jgi:hypothetical protein
MQNFTTIVAPPFEKASYPSWDLEDGEVGTMMQATSLFPGDAILSAGTRTPIGAISDERDLALLTSLIEALKELQAVLGADANLEDAASVLSALQQKFGMYAPLERAIQTLVGCHLSYQLACRRAQRGERCCAREHTAALSGAPGREVLV